MVHVELMQDHVGLGPHFAFFTNDFDKLANRKGACDLPVSYPDDKTFVFQSNRVLRFNYALRHLDVIWYKHAKLALLSF